MRTPTVTLMPLSAMSARVGAVPIGRAFVTVARTAAATLPPVASGGTATFSGMSTDAPGTSAIAVSARPSHEPAPALPAVPVVPVPTAGTTLPSLRSVASSVLKLTSRRSALVVFVAVRCSDFVDPGRSEALATGLDGAPPTVSVSGDGGAGGAVVVRVVRAVRAVARETAGPYRSTAAAIATATA